MLSITATTQVRSLGGGGLGCCGVLHKLWGGDVLEEAGNTQLDAWDRWRQTEPPPLGWAVLNDGVKLGGSF